VSGTAVLGGLEHLPAVSLTDLNSAAALQMRVDRKYVLTVSAAEALLDRLDPDVRVLEIDGLRRLKYESIYFDTPSLAAYHLSAHRRPRRFKVRTRTYVDTQQCMFEVKLRNARGNTEKHRIDHEIMSCSQLTDEATRFLEGFETLGSLRDDLRPTLTTSYERTTLLWAGCRTTLDVDVVCTAAPGVGATCEKPARATLRDRVILETKSPGGAGNIDRMLWSAGVRPVAVSKYATGMAAILPELPSNKWHRTLARHVTLETGCPTRRCGDPQPTN
jgi:hypothetical protein